MLYFPIWQRVDENLSLVIETLYGFSFNNPENNQGYMLSSIEDIINSVQKLFARESLTSSKLRTIFPK